MATEVWFRNPHDYIRELVECGATNVAWDRGLLVKRGIDPIKHAELFYAGAYQWRVLAVGSQGSAEYRPGDTLEKPTAVYPTWVYGEDSIILEEMIEHPIGQDAVSCSDVTVPGDERPVWNQEHRVIVTEMPPSNTGPGKNFLRYLKTLQEDYPDCIIHLHGGYSWKTAFGLGWGAADIEPRTAAQKGKVHLPSGSVEKFERLVAKPQWTAALGFKPADLSVPRNRCMYNIKSAIWAGENYQELFKFKTQGAGSGDYESSDNDHVPAETRSPLMPTAPKAVEGDKTLCDTCSLQDKCRYYRAGAVCTVPGAETVKLAHMFKSRDADTIIDALGTITAAGASRLERSMELEKALNETDPEVTRMMGQVFDQGTKLAKLLEPQRFSPGSKVQVNVGAGASASVQGGNARQLVAGVIQELVNQGVPRDKITPEMVQGVLEGSINGENQIKAIQGTVTAVRDEVAEA